MSTFNCSDVVIFTGDPVKSQRFLTRRVSGQPYRITNIRHADGRISFDGGRDFYSSYFSASDFHPGKTHFCLGDSVLFRTPGKEGKFVVGCVDSYDHKKRKYKVKYLRSTYYLSASKLTHRW